MSEPVITFKVPKNYVNPDEMVTHDVVVLPWVEGKSLKLYYRDTKFTYRLQIKNLRYNVRKVDSREPVRTSYVPQPGETFVFIPAGRAMS